MQEAQQAEMEALSVTIPSFLSPQNTTPHGTPQMLVSPKASPHKPITPKVNRQPMLDVNVSGRISISTDSTDSLVKRIKIYYHV